MNGGALGQRVGTLNEAVPSREENSCQIDGQLRQRFDDFISRNTNKKSSETNFKRKGSLGVALHITQSLIDRAHAFPLRHDDFLAASGTQVSGLSGRAVNKILDRHGIDRSLGTEVGRTNRGAPLHLRVYLDFLNALHDEGILDLKAIQCFWIEKVREFFAGKPFDLKLDPTLGLRSVVRNLLRQAEQRQREMRGFQFAGTLAQHLIGAKLDLVLGHDDARHHGSNHNDANGRSGDFVICDVPIHVTLSPSEMLIRKCKDNLRDGLRPIIVTTYSRIHVAEAMSEDMGVGGRIDIFEIEQFIASNVFELSLFRPEDRRITVSELVRRYNQIIDMYETDPSLKIHFDG